MVEVLPIQSQAPKIFTTDYGFIGPTPMESKNRREGGLRRITFAELLDIRDNPRREKDLLNENRILIAEWNEKRPLLNPFSQLISNGVYDIKLENVWNIGVAELEWLTRRVVEEAEESRDVVMNPYTPKDRRKNCRADSCGYEEGRNTLYGRSFSRYNGC